MTTENRHRTHPSACSEAGTYEPPPSRALLHVGGDPSARGIGRLVPGPMGVASPSPPRWRGTSNRPRAASNGPNTRSDSYWLWARHRSEMFSTVGSPPIPYGSRWWNSR